MAYLVRTSAQAERDLESIYQFIQAETSDHAALWFNGLCAAIKKLADMPQSFPVTREHPGMRHLLYGHKPHIYRVLYRIDEPSRLVDILTVRHGARDAYSASKADR